MELRRERRRPAELARCQLARKLQQGEGVAAGLGDDPFHDLVGGHVPETLLEQGS
jgi:hypothetical protein